MRVYRGALGDPYAGVGGRARELPDGKGRISADPGEIDRTTRQEKTMNPTETAHRMPDARALRRLIGGPALCAGAAGYDQARGVFNLTIDQRPALIAEPGSREEVAAVVNFAREEGLRVAPQRTGHNAGPLGSLEGTVLLKTNRLDRVHVDKAARRARTGSSARWEDVVPAASELGLAALHGSTPDVSVAGYSLGGGMGWYARKHGLAANSIRAIELVTADGEIRRVDHESEPELFWALRGGGGNYGVVTALGSTCCRSPRSSPGRSSSLRARRRGAPRLARVDRQCPRRGHLGRPDAAVPAGPRSPGAGPRQVVRPGRGGLPRHRGGGP
jgi:hypothetical protein